MVGAEESIPNDVLRTKNEVSSPFQPGDPTSPPRSQSSASDNISINSQTTEQDDHDQRDMAGLEVTRTPTQTIISFRPSDPEHPNNWRTKWKVLVVAGGLMSVMNSTLCSSLPTGAVDEMAKYFDIKSSEQLVLPISIFLIGYVVGPLLCGPLSENFGRKPVMTIAFFFYTVWMLGCALAPTWPAFLIFRWLAGTAASAPIAIVGALYADIFGDPRKRGVAMASFMGATTFGPVLGPIVSGFLSPITWRWTYWFGLIFAGATWPFLIFMPETYVPVLIAQKAKKIRRETGNTRIIASSELQKKSFRYVMTIVMTRPFRMLIHESIVTFTCMYVTLAFAIFYLFFEVRSSKSYHHDSD